MGVRFYGSGGPPFNKPPKYDAFFCPCGLQKLSLHQLRRKRNTEINPDLSDREIRVLYILAKTSRGLTNRLLPLSNCRHTIDNSTGLTWNWLRARRGSYDLESLCQFLDLSVQNKSLWAELIDNDFTVNEVPVEGVETFEALQKDKDCWSGVYDLPSNPRNHSPTYTAPFECLSDYEYHSDVVETINNFHIIDNQLNN